MLITEAEILKTITEHRLDVEVLGREERDNFVKEVKKKYLKPKILSSFLWEAFLDFSVIVDEKGWSYVKDFVDNSSCIMFLGESDGRNAYRIKNGDQLNTLISESFGFEFYITDSSINYLICFNHHDGLMGCGKAKDWILSLGGEVYTYLDDQ